MEKEPEERRTCPICGHVFKSRAVMRNHYVNRVCEKYRDYNYRTIYYGRKNRQASESEEREEKVQG